MPLIVRLIPALLIAFFSLAPPRGAGRTGEEEWPADFGVRAKKHIEAIVAIGPRRAGTPNEGRAAEYVAGQFRAMGVPALIESFAFESFESAAVELRIGADRLTPVRTLVIAKPHWATSEPRLRYDSFN